MLDAPDLTDDYYLNLLDWSSQNVVRYTLLITLRLHTILQHTPCVCASPMQASLLITKQRRELSADGTLPSALPLHTALQHAK